MVASPYAFLLVVAAASAAAITPLLIVVCALLLCAPLVAAVFYWRRRRWCAQHAERALQRLTVARVMEPASEGVLVTASLDDLRSTFLAEPEKRSLHVTQWGQLVGMISRKDMRRVEESRWASVPVGAAMTPLERLLTLEPEQSLWEAHRLMAHREVDHAPVVVRGRVAGVVSMDAVRALIAERRPTQDEEAAQHLRQRLPVAN